LDKGLKNGDMDTVDAGTKVMGHIGEKAAQLTTRIENNY
jgi:hypothetical protein